MNTHQEMLDSIPEPYRSAHQECKRNREKVLAGKRAGCFYCLAIFDPQTIREWLDGEQTARCPICGVDSVLPDSPTLTDEFLKQMHEEWFEK
jgi:hypothetical protein